MGPRGSGPVVTLGIGLSPPPRVSRECLGGGERTGGGGRRLGGWGSGGGQRGAAGWCEGQRHCLPGVGGGGHRVPRDPRSAAQPGGGTAKFGLPCAEVGAGES